MDYEKKYKDALSWIKDVYPTFEGALKEDAEHFFPELKESEDERIRGKLIEEMRHFQREAAKESCDADFDFAKSAIAWLEKQGEQNPAWSEDDELYLEDAIHAAEELYYANCGGDELVDWLKSLKDRVQPQPQKEWSEEDERMRKASIRACQYMVENFENSTWDYEDAIEWLKSLKPQPQWKPSDEQLNALDEVYKTHGANNVCRRIIFNLLEQLKKL